MHMLHCIEWIVMQLKLPHSFLLFLAPYIKQCRSSDPEILECLKGSLHHLKPYLKAGIPEIEVSVKSQLFFN